MGTLLKRLRKTLLEESGQAVIEYILVLTVVIGVVLGSLYQLNDAFRKWADSYFGDYLACLIESGELPSLGGAGGGECSQQFKPFSLADGVPLVDGGAGGGGGGGTSEGDQNQTGEFGKGGSGSSGVYTGGGGSVVVQSVPNASLGGNSQRFRARGSGNRASGESEDEASSNTGSAAITDLGSYQSGKAIRIPLREAGGIRGSARIEEEKEKETKTKVSSSSIETESRKGVERIKVERRVASTEQTSDVEGFTFGKFLRYLIIAAIIIAIILFIGGQVVQVSKSM